jgi:predicted enzyme related to lactoylglutathione lyase
MTAYSFTKLVVRDLEAMARYYADVYDLTELQRVQAAIAGVPIDEIILGQDGAYGGLILLNWVGQDPPPTGEVILGFTTADLPALVERAVAAGGVIREAPRQVAEAGGLLVGFVTDPEGHLAEVVEQAAD